MGIVIRKYSENDLGTMANIWNHVVKEGKYFPQIDVLSLKEATAFFAEQTFTGVAEEDGVIVGLYILHPNNIGRCGHIANASYAVAADQRGKRIGEKLVVHSLEMAKESGFRIMQFNAVVADNKGAISLYKKLGFKELGTIPGGFKMDDGTFVDIIPFYFELSSI
ncbi:MAG TPA: GNAT family N-acetyltransferase [Trichococcus sp.]|jgi:L-amino acid N-acyltransferase YncA|uniref:GNAT family N-acetyltransferase n=1 Tax=Trichococcus flocculiformis TaxID=82803 RepID=UPI000E94BB07|nr:GNAT family N-acetyltransferase [Trichococcus sp.]HRG30749.1 GNAT family N-acetyltransferase [Trichococcus flocculiformis]